jgi:hypothetical protein
MAGILPSVASLAPDSLLTGEYLTEYEAARGVQNRGVRPVVCAAP